MKKQIKLTQKQQQVLNSLGDMLEKENFKQIPVSDIYCNMTAVKQIITANWFDRTFNKLEELGLVEKENMGYEVKGGYKKGQLVETYCYNLTELGLEYLGIANLTKTDEQPKEKVHYKLVCKDCNTIIESNEEYIYNALTGCYYHRKCGGNHLVLEINSINNK